jgi:hypothetical protein
MPRFSFLSSVLLLGAVAFGCNSSDGFGSGIPDGATQLPDGQVVFPDGRVWTPGCGPDACHRDGKTYCGPIEDPCGPSLVECGSCPQAQACGIAEPSVCGRASRRGRRACTGGLCESQVSCEGTGGHEATTLTGTVYAPDGVTPLNNAVVYVPNNPDPGALPPIPEGASCERCEDEDLGDPIAGAITGPDGSFTLRDVPAGVSFPLVVKAGKWRRVVMIDQPVEACTSQALSATQTRLPRNRTEGHIPKIAVVTGAVDALECVLHRMGVDASEFTRASEDGRIHLYRSNGAWANEELEDDCHNGCHNNRVNNWRCTNGPAECGEQLAHNLYRDQAKLDSYDMIFFGCDYDLNDSTRNSTWTEEDHARIKTYGDKGGRLFLSHFNHEWLSRSRAPDELRDLADYGGGWHEGLGDPSRAWIDTDFTRGLTFLQWLEHVGAAWHDFSEGHINIHEPRTHIAELYSPAQQWVYTTQEDHNRDSVQSFTVDMPVGAPADNTCGRTVYSAFHVIDGDDMNEDYFPNHCASGDLRPQELALIFMMFDLAACITDRPPEWDCTPISCDEAGAECGRVIDGCGGLQDCGGCPPNHLCNPATNRCQAVG